MKKNETFDNEMLWMGFVLIDYSVSVDEFHLFIDIYVDNTKNNTKIQQIRCSMHFCFVFLGYSDFE